MSSKLSKIIKNGESSFFVIDVDSKKNKLLLQRISDNEVVIAYNIVWLDDLKCCWGTGSYFGRHLERAVKEFNK